MVKMVFSDMDGTFLTPEKRITPENMRILDAMGELGVQFVPCTGRNFGDLPPELLSHPSVRYAVCCNGALVMDVVKREVLHEVFIDKDVVRSLYADVRGLSVTFDIFADGRVFTSRRRFPIIGEVSLDPPTRSFVEAGRTVFDCPTQDLLERVGGVCRLNSFYHTREEAQAVWAAVDAYPMLRRASSLPCNVEITHRDAHKGSAVVWLCEKLGISPQDCIAFGDNDNDLTMLQVVGDGVAMKNAVPACRAVADHTAEGCADSGVARYLAPLLGV